MPEFTPPYSYTFDPPAVSTGSPTVINRGVAARGGRAFVLQSNPTGASSADLITSFGVDAGVAGDVWNMPGVPAQLLAVTAIFDFSSLIFANGVLASIVAADWANIYVEEFDERGRFLGASQSPDHVFRREDFFYFGGGDEWDDHLRSAIFSWTRPIVRGHFYRVWFDVHGTMRAAGFGFGGSGARVQFDLTLTILDAFFVER